METILKNNGTCLKAGKKGKERDGYFQRQWTLFIWDRNCFPVAIHLYSFHFRFLLQLIVVFVFVDCFYYIYRLTDVVQFSRFIGSRMLMMVAINLQE